MEEGDHWPLPVLNVPTDLLKEPALINTVRPIIVDNMFSRA